MLNVCPILFHLILRGNFQSRYNYPHFSNDKSDAFSE